MIVPRPRRWSLCLLAATLTGCAAGETAQRKEDRPAASESAPAAGDAAAGDAAGGTDARARTDASRPAVFAGTGASNLDLFRCAHATADAPCTVDTPAHFGPDLEPAGGGAVYVAPVPGAPDRSFVLVRSRAPAGPARAETPHVLVLLDESDLGERPRRRVHKLLDRLAHERAAVWLLPFGDRTGQLAPYTPATLATILARSGPTALTLPPVLDAARQAVRALDEPLHSVVVISARTLGASPKVALGAPVVFVDVYPERDQRALASGYARAGATVVAGFGDREAQDRAVDAIVHHCRAPYIRVVFDDGASSHAGAPVVAATGVVGPRTTLNALLDVARTPGPLRGTATVGCVAPAVQHSWALDAATVVDDVAALPGPARRALARQVWAQQRAHAAYPGIDAATLRDWLAGDPTAAALAGGSGSAR